MNNSGRGRLYTSPVLVPFVGTLRWHCHVTRARCQGVAAARVAAIKGASAPLAALTVKMLDTNLLDLPDEVLITIGALLIATCGLQQG